MTFDPDHPPQVFSRESGISLFEYLTELRMQQARLLLQSAEESSAQIPLMVNLWRGSKTDNRRLTRGSPSSWVYERIMEGATSGEPSVAVTFKMAFLNHA